MDLANREYTYSIEAKISSMAKAGVDVGQGSALGDIASSIAAQAEEIIAIKRKGELDFKLASMRGLAAQNEAETLRSTSFNLLQAAAAITGNLAASSDTWGRAFYSQPASGGSDMAPGETLLGPTDVDMSRVNRFGSYA